jgi:ATP-dependent DNA helicase RecG
VKALKAVLGRVDVENTIFTKIGYPLREEREMINSIAMREAVINAVVHNDYSYGAVPKIEFFSDRVEVTSMGGLPYGVEEDDFFNGGSVPRNKEIMRVFRDLEIVEHLGSGILRIVNAYGKEAFEIRKSFVRVNLVYAKPIVEATPQVAPESSGEKFGEKFGENSATSPQQSTDDHSRAFSTAWHLYPRHRKKYQIATKQRAASARWRGKRGAMASAGEQR